MNKILVPLDNLSEISLNAARYAVEFAKRSSSRPIFLFLSKNDFAKSDSFVKNISQTEGRKKEIKDKIDLLVEQSAEKGIKIEQHECRGEYIEKVCEFVRNLNITVIVIALPDKNDPRYKKIEKNISLLVQMTSCRILTVKKK